MKQLKITKSKARKHIPIINEYLKSEDFNLGKFSKTIVEAELLVEEKEDYIIGAFQDLERSHVLVMSHLHGRNYAELIAELREEGEDIENLFANAKISRCRNEVIKVANCVEWKMVDTAVHLPDDYDERNKFIRSKPFIVQDALHNGECKDFVKVADSEWFICTVHEEVRIPVLELTDRNSMRNAFESLMEILENLIERKTMSFSEWRAEMGI